jgi:hypothetical protein
MYEFRSPIFIIGNYLRKLNQSILLQLILMVQDRKIV